MDADEVKKVWELDKNFVAHQFGEALRDFGYSSVTDGWAKAEIERLYAGGKATGGPSMFIAGWLEDGMD